MEEQEAPLEDVHEQIHHHAEHTRERWVSAVALSTALLAALAAICSLFSGDNADEALLEQMQATDKWSHYQATSIKLHQLEVEGHLLESNGKTMPQKDREQLAKYRGLRESLFNHATELRDSTEHHHFKHGILAKGVTMFQIAIAVSAISVLTGKRWFWYMGLGFGCVGLYFLLHGTLVMHAPGQERATTQRAVDS